MAERTRYRYTGDEPVLLSGLGSPYPDEIEPGGLFDVDAVGDGGPDYAADPRFEQLEHDGELPRPSLPEPIPASALPGDADELKGQELDDALRAAGLSTSGTVAARRERLSAHYANATGVQSVDPSIGEDTSA